MTGLSKALKELLDRVESWPRGDQEELARIGRDIETGRAAAYHPTPDELAALEDADASGVATEAEVEAVLTKFRRA